ncbi:MAG: hypothetical protein WBQ18_19500, partial [Solirubrobacteraceae bacterium]
RSVVGQGRKGSDGSPLGSPHTVEVTLKVTPETLALFDVARTDPSLGFVGNLSDFVNMVVPAFFHSLGARGLRLVWEPPPPPPPPAPGPGYVPMTPAIVMGEGL